MHKTFDNRLSYTVLVLNNLLQIAVIYYNNRNRELQYRTTSDLLERFEFINKLPEMFEQRFVAIQEKYEKDGAEADYLEQWKQGIVIELRQNVQNITSLNRELRENSKFMADMRSKAFEFDLIQEELYLFMEVFRKADLEAYEIASAQIAANPRMLSDR